MESFPKLAAFKNMNIYLIGTRIEALPYLKFGEDSDAGERVLNQLEVVSESEQIYRIKSIYFTKYWRRNPETNWILADGDASENPDTLFKLVRPENTKIALLNMGNGKYCGKHTSAGITNCLNAASEVITNEAKLQLVEMDNNPL